MRVVLFILVFLFTQNVFSDDNTQLRSIIGSAYLENQSYQALQRICDEAGGRLTGSEQNKKAMQIWESELRKLGVRPQREAFSMPGWVRGNDLVKVVSPFRHRLKAVALGYVAKHPDLTTELVYLNYGQEADFESAEVKGKAVLVTSERPKTGKALMRFEIIRLAERFQAAGVLFINTKNGGINLAGTASFEGTCTSIPAYSLNLEEGRWLRRLLQAGKSVQVHIHTESYCTPVQTANMVVRFPGKDSQKIVIGAHFDSWDLSQGAIDNGIGTAILFDLTRLIRTFFPKNEYTIEVVWFNGEELGLFGSKNYMARHKDDAIRVMINMDMTGKPTGFNAMGRDALIPLLQQVNMQLGGLALERGVVNAPWTNSDHMPFMLAGIPTITMTAHLDKEQGRYYHSIGDSFDKVKREYLSAAAAVTAVLVRELANNPSVTAKRFSEEETQKMLLRFKLDERLRREGEWPVAHERVR
jgi:Iap family predicted aminopeptidase